MPPPTQRSNSSSSAPPTAAEQAKAVQTALTALSSAIHGYISSAPKKDAARRRCAKQVYHLLGRLLEE